tara:strand:+ start:304 stop:510 length:207 start_codon:yes stop_codon:yes gene_type:complete
MRLILILTTLLAFQSAAASEFDEIKARAELGVSSAQFNLALMYATGRGVPENDAVFGLFISANSSIRL